VDQPVTVSSEAGSMEGVLVRTLDVREGNAVMYFPEANGIVPRVADPASRTPAFKSARITIRPGRSPAGAESGPATSPVRASGASMTRSGMKAC
jgi:hypothetical protein